ncbi:MAG: SH3 domain-containing protein [Blautia sp.]|nr:SH3 domain-containing protein [Blautia sp.]
MKAIKFEELDKVTGGVLTEVQHCENSGANVRMTPGLDGKVCATLANGTMLETTGSCVEKDGIVWYQVHLASGSDDAWIAGSLIGF